MRGTIAVFEMPVLLAVTVSAAAYSGGGNGSPESPYRIATAEDLNDIGNHVEDFNKCFVLVNDINLADYTGTQFNMIGQYFGWNNPNNCPFSGVFDGNGHAISNFSYTCANRELVGLFGDVYGDRAEIKDLVLRNPKIAANDTNCVGCLAGWFEDGAISNCRVVNGTIHGNSRFVGGLVGYHLYGTVSACSFAGDVSGRYKVGGLIGYNTGVLLNCYSSGAAAGGELVGGLVGQCWHPWFAEIRNCYSTVDVNGNNYVGGLVGGNGSIYDGGPEDYPIISKCYSSGNVTGDSNTGGLVGSNNAVVAYCFWDVDSSSQSVSEGGVGRPTAEMQTESTFTDAGWDFVNIWDICEATNYPRFLWQIPVADFVCPDGVNFMDFAFFAEWWGAASCCSCNNCEGTNLDFLNGVDWRDFRIFCQQWLEGI